MHNRSTTCDASSKTASRNLQKVISSLGRFPEKYGTVKNQKRKTSAKTIEAVSKNDKAPNFISRSINRVQQFLAKEEIFVPKKPSHTIFQSDPFKMLNDSYENAYDLPSPNFARFYNSEKKV